MAVLLTVAYDGTAYCGWQRQDNGLAVQEVLERAASITYGREITVTGASRTDTGVHALGQRAVIRADSAIPTEKLPYALNSRLPEDIRVVAAKQVAADFHPQYGAKQKTYRYRIWNGPFANPILRNHTWHVYYPLDIRAMEKGAAYMVGEHDFKAFRASGGSAKTSVRRIFGIELYRDGNGREIYFDVCGNGFLYNMVRIIAGTLVYCGCGKIDPGSIGEIIAAGDRTKAGITAPPQGLTLMEICYE